MFQNSNKKRQVKSVFTYSLQNRCQSNIFYIRTSYHKVQTQMCTYCVNLVAGF